MSDIAIVGAGLGGLTTALALARAGARVRVYEQAPVLAEIGAGITLSPNASRILDQFGLGEDLARLGFVPARQWTQHWQTGAVLRDFVRGEDMQTRYGAGYYHLHRADLHALLTGALLAIDPQAIQLGRRLVRADAPGAMHFADGSTTSADVVIGADGVRSVVRDSLFQSPPPHFTGQVAWRGIVPVDRLPAAVQALPPGIHVGPGRLFVRYPLRGGALINFAAFVELSGWETESWSIRSSVDELLSHFASWDESVRAFISGTPADQLYKWALHAREPLESWTTGHVTLIGDAAHAMLPFLGQGAATAMEDGIVLARCLMALERAPALARYEALRRDRATLIQTQSRLVGLQLQGKNPQSLGKGPVHNEETMGLFDYDAATVPL